MAPTVPTSCRSPHSTKRVLNAEASGPTPRPLIGLLIVPVRPPTTPNGVGVAGRSKPKPIQASVNSTGPRMAPSASRCGVRRAAGVVAGAVVIVAEDMGREALLSNGVLVTNVILALDATAVNYRSIPERRS